MKQLILSLALALVLAISFAPSADAAVINVSCTGGPLGPITAAPGDVVVVSGFCSSGFVVNNLTDVLIVGADGPSAVAGAYPAGLGTNGPSNPLIYDLNNSCGIIRDSSNITVVGFIFEYCGGHGITIQDSSDIHIGGNSFYGSGQHGIEVVQSNQVEIFGNYLYNAQNGGFAGIFVDPTSRFTQIHDNRVAKNNNGILIEGDRATVTLNEVFGNTNLGISLDSRLSTVARNTVTDNDPGTPQIYYVAQPPGSETCVVGNDTATAGVMAFGLPLCESDNI